MVPAPVAVDVEHDAADAEAAVELAVALLTAARSLEPAPHRRRARRLHRLIEDERSMRFSLALTDQVARIDDPVRAARRLRDLVSDQGTPAFLGPLDRLVLRVGASVGHLAPGLVAGGIRRRLQRESAGVVLPADDPGLAEHVARRHAAGIDLNINVLGEAILGDGEARRRLDDVLAHVDRPDVDYVSVKVSSVCARTSSLAFERTVDRIAEPLRELYHRAAAAEPAVFVNLDMEEYRDLELTLAVFTRLLAEPDLAHLDAGIVLQAYLPDSHAAFEGLAAWAVGRRQAGGGRTKVRLVKGANLAMERVEAELHGWTAAPYDTKAAVDASYKRLLDRALAVEWGDALRIGLASHNLFDVAWGLVRAHRLGIADRVEPEMLEGMAPGEAEAVRRREGGIRLYAPVVRNTEFDAAIAYLIRRLDENTGPDNFLRHQFELDPGSAAFAEQRARFLTSVGERHHVDATPRRAQDRRNEHRSFDVDAAFVNEPDTDWTAPANRVWIADRARSTEDDGVVDVAIRMGDDVVGPTEAPSVLAGFDPSAPERPVSRAALADRALVEQAVAGAVAAQRAWGATAARERAELLVRAASLLADRRGTAIITMGRDAGKTIPEADPEVSEAVDMATYYARSALALDDPEADHRPLGPVVVVPPWNFPYAIPAGGVFASLAAGNTVILKPAPETILTASVLASCLWDAGIPPGVVQFVPCPDDEVGRSLVTHPDVAAVILTGSAETAQLFLSWKPSMRLHAETSGKNAIVVTAAADLDQAVKDVVHSAFAHAGQKCSAASLVIVEQSVLDGGRFLPKLADATRSLRVGPASDPSVDVGPLIGPPSERLRRALLDLGAGERWLVAPEPRHPEGRSWSPGIRLGVRPGSFLHRTECFGPVLGVMAARDLDHAIDLQNAGDYGLTGGLHSLDPDEIARWLDRVEVGNAYVNRSITGAIVGRQPFGGWKRSSVGPGAKAGGPAYVASLCAWSDRPGDRLARAERSYPAAWRDLSAPSDPTGLRAERNEHRHVPLRVVLLRVEPGSDPTDADLCLLAARTTGTRIVTSGGAEPIADLVCRIGLDRPDVVRVLGPVPEELRRAAADAWLPLDDRPPVADGHIELGRWSREQSVSICNHRHGNTRAV